MSLPTVIYEVILTFNLRDFPPTALEPHGVVAGTAAINEDGCGTADIYGVDCRDANNTNPKC